MRKREVIILVVFVLSFIGVMMVLSASYIKSMEKFGDGFFYFKKQAIFVCIGFILMVVSSFLKPGFYYRISYLSLILLTLLLILVFFPGIGVKINGAYRWIRIGGWTLQPSEYVKIALCLSLARFFSTEPEGVRKLLIPLLMYIPIGVLLLKEPDMGTAAFLFLITITACFVGGLSLKHLIFAGTAGCVLVSGYLLMNKNTAEKKHRIMAFLNPEEYQKSEGYQILQSIYAIGAGGITGVGPGKGKAKLHYLPEPFTDYIFSVLGEEMGFVGSCLLLGLFVVLFVSGVKISISAEEPFISLSTFLLTFLICFQAVVHIGVTLALLPPKGITLPFVSYGGNSIFSAFISVGIILSMERRSERK
jgi:cell division protein FtsW